MMFALVQGVPMHLLDTLSGDDGLYAFRVIRGTWHDTPIIQGEYRYAHYSGDDPPSYGVLRFGIAFMQRTAPRILIRRHRPFARRLLNLSRRRAQAFDPQFRVTTDAPEAAELIFTRRAREWLAANDAYGSYLIDGHQIAVLAPYRHDLQDVSSLLDWLRQFRAILEREMTDVVG